MNADVGEYGNAHQAVSNIGNDAIVKLLLRNRAEVNAKAGLYAGKMGP